MRFVDEYRDPAAARLLVAHIAELAGQRLFKFMEVCGGHTHTIYRHGLEHLLPESVELVHGPGCPVCVIPMGRVDDAIAVAETPGVIFTSFGDMMRVPGGNGNSARGQSPWRRRARRVLAARRLEPCGRQPRSRGGLLRRRLRDDGAVDRHHVAARPRARRHELPGVLQPRHDRPADPGDSGVPRPPPRRLHRSRPCVHGGRQPSLPIRAGVVWQAARHHRVRAARHPAGDRHAAHADPRRTV